jgi:hypothetical protein
MRRFIVIRRTKLISLLLLFAVACSGWGVTTTNSPNLSHTMLPTLTSFLTVTPLKSPSPTPSPPLATANSEPTLTSTPTLSPAQVQEMVLGLIRSNGNCDLPCWWGLKPGEATFKETDRLLSPLSVRPTYIAGDPNENALVGYGFTVPEALSVLGEVDLDIVFKQSRLEHLRIYLLQWDAYSLPNLLKKYGPPDEILVHTYQWVPGGPPPFALFLFYPQKGILAYYPSQPEKNEVKVTETKIRGCFSRSAELYLWSPQKSWTLKEATDHMSVGILNQEEKLKLPIYEATGMRVQDFYQTIKDSKTVPCIETAKKLWPVP